MSVTPPPTGCPYETPEKLCPTFAPGPKKKLKGHTTQTELELSCMGNGTVKAALFVPGRHSFRLHPPGATSCTKLDDVEKGKERGKNETYATGYINTASPEVRVG